MDVMTMARFNIYWFLSLIAPAIVMLITTYKKSRLWLVTGVVLSVLMTYTLCNWAVQEKWRIRNEVAVTDQQRRYGTADGANLVFTAFFIAPIEALGYTVLWGYVGRKAWSKRSMKDKKT